MPKFEVVSEYRPSGDQPQAIEALASGIENGFMRFLMKFISLFARYQNFSLGLFALDDIVYYISITVIFLFLTGRVIEKKRWA